MRLSPINRRRWQQFRANRRGWWSLWIFVVLFALSLGAELLANDKPLLVRYDGRFYFPVLFSYPEVTFGGDFATEAEYRDPFVRELIERNGWMLWPLPRWTGRWRNWPPRGRPRGHRSVLFSRGNLPKSRPSRFRRKRIPHANFPAFARVLRSSFAS